MPKKNPVDLRIDKREKPKYRRLLRRDGTTEQITEEEWERYVAENPNSPTAQEHKKMLEMQKDKTIFENRQNSSTAQAANKSAEKKAAEGS